MVTRAIKVNDGPHLIYKPLSHCNHDYIAAGNDRCRNWPMSSGGLLRSPLHRKSYGAAL